MEFTPGIRYAFTGSAYIFSLFVEVQFQATLSRPLGLIFRINGQISQTILCIHEGIKDGPRRILLHNLHNQSLPSR